jgi:hypothetical protein
MRLESTLLTYALNLCALWLAIISDLMLLYFYIHFMLGIDIWANLAYACPSPIKINDNNYLLAKLAL